jgi:hypothetical protein
MAAPRSGSYTGAHATGLIWSMALALAMSIPHSPSPAGR